MGNLSMITCFKAFTIGFITQSREYRYPYRPTTTIGSTIAAVQTMPSYDTSARKQLYDTQGYVVVPSLISPSLLLELEEACTRTIAKTREGSWPHRRTVGRQFPPYDDGNPDSWGVQHVMHPDLGERAFARWYTSDELVNVVCELMACGEEDLQMGERYCMLEIPIEGR